MAERTPAVMDVLDELHTLDQACGDVDRWFRLKVRQMIERRYLVAERQRIVAEIGRD